MVMPLLIPFLQRFRYMKDDNEDKEDNNEENEEDLNHKDVDDMKVITEKYVKNERNFKKYQQNY